MELTLDEAIQQAIAAHREGRLQDAERLYRAILEAQPNHPDANHNLGVLAVAVGKPLEALPFFMQALEVNPKVEQFWLSYLDAQIKLERFDDAGQILIDAEQSGVSAEKLVAIKQQLQVGLSKNTNDPAKDPISSEKKKAPSAKAPSQTQINTLLEHYQKGRLEEAEALSTLLTQQFSNHPFGWKVLGGILRQKGKLHESLLPMQKSVELAPQDAEAHCNLGVTLRDLDRVEEAEKSYRQAVFLKPEFVDAHCNLGNTLREMGRLAEAANSYLQAIEIMPECAEAHCNLGVALKELGQFDEAEASYRQATVLKPDFFNAHNNLGNLLRDARRLDEAEASYLQAIKLKPDFAEAHSNLGVTQAGLGLIDEAETSYKKAIALRPDFVEALLNLCDLLEKNNDIDELSTVLAGVGQQPSRMAADFNYYKALAAFRTDRFSEAITLSSEVAECQISATRKAPYLKLKGDLNHWKADYDAAFSFYKQSNSNVRLSDEFRRLESASESYFLRQKERLRQLQKLTKDASPPSEFSADKTQPTFLIGFPRSGTTLLDTILRTHSRIDVVEEQPMVGKMSVALGNPHKVTMVESLSESDVRVATRAYFEELERHSQLCDDILVIDKLPLNILQAPLINRIFPGARYILCLRHPLDCVLSSWMQNFELNPAMANMVDLDRAVEFYCVAVEIFELSRKRYQLNTHEIRYEDLIEDFETEASNLLSFLGLDWEPELHNFQMTAKSREAIRTPSHSQVIKPLYRNASFRWKHYEDYLDKYIPQLAPWIKKYGYS